MDVGVAEIDELLFQLVLVSGNRMLILGEGGVKGDYTYGSGYRFNPKRSISTPFLVPLTSLPSSVRSSDGPKAFSFASSRMFVPSSL